MDTQGMKIADKCRAGISSRQWAFILLIQLRVFISLALLNYKKTDITLPNGETFSLLPQIVKVKDDCYIKIDKN